MARLALSAQTTPGSYPALPLSANAADGWRQSTGLIHGAASAADVMLAVIRLK